MQIFKRDNVRPLGRRLIVAFVQSMSSTIGYEQQRRTTPPTAAGVRLFAKGKSIPHSTIEIPINSSDLKIPPAVIHVLDLNPDAAPGSSRRAIFYLHGGGYVVPPSAPGQVGMALEMAKTAKARYLLVLEYGLAPEVAYPGQLVQAAAALKVLCAKACSDVAKDVTGSDGAAEELVSKFDGPSIAEDLVLIGDSAGGHLILSLLAHLKSPCPHAPSIKLPQPLRAAVMLSPWVTTSYDAPSYTSNAGVDFLQRHQMVYFDEMWKPKRDEVWADLLKAAPTKSFWTEIFSGSDRLVASSLITTGSDEVFRDDIVAFADLAGASGKGSNIKFIECAGEAHVGYVVDFMANHPEGDMRKGTTEFLKAI